MKIRRILCPVDFSASSNHALDAAVDLAKQLGAELEIVHVYGIPVVAMPDGAVMATAEWVVRITTELQVELDKLTARVRETGLTVHPRLVEGVPHQEIVRLAKEHKADLVVMSTHGRGGLSHFFMGSVAERVVRLCESPVMTFRHQ